MCVRSQHEVAGIRPAWSAVKSQAVFKSQDKKKGREEGEEERRKKIQEEELAWRHRPVTPATWEATEGRSLGNFVKMALKIK